MYKKNKSNKTEKWWEYRKSLKKQDEKWKEYKKSLDNIPSYLILQKASDMIFD